MPITIGQRFVRRHNAARGSTSNTTASDIAYDTAVTLEGGYSWSSPEVTVDTAGKYLLIFDIGQVNLASTRAVGTLIPQVNGAAVRANIFRATHRYLRNSGGAQEGASIGMCILDLNASDAVKVRNPGAITPTDSLGNYATDASVGGGLQLIRLPDINFTHVERTVDANEVGFSSINTTRPWIDTSGSWTKYTYNVEVSDDDALYPGSGGDVTLAANTKYMIVYGASCYSTSSTRIAFVTALNIDGTRRHTASGYQRNSASQGPPMAGTYLYETGGSPETLFLEGTAEFEGATLASRVLADAYLQIVELPSSAEWVHADNGATDSLSTALVSTTTWYETPLSSTQRTDSSADLSLDAANNAIQNDSGGTLPVLAIGWHRWDRDGTSTARKAPWTRWNNGGAAVAYGVSGAYSRGNQGSIDTWQAHHCTAVVIDLAASDDLTLEVQDVTSATQGDMGIYASTSRHFLGVQALNLATLEASSTAYDETGLTVTVVSTVAGTDGLTGSESGSAGVVSAVSGTDTAAFDETGGQSDITSTVTGTDSVPGAVIDHVYLETNVAFTTTSGAGAIPTNGTIAGSALAANTKYLIIARALVGMNNATGHGIIQVQADDDSNVATKSQTRIEFQQTAAGGLKSWFFAHSFTTDSSPGDVEFAVASLDGSSTLTIDQYTMLLIDLDGLGASNYLEDINADPELELSTTVWGTEIASLAAADLGTTEEWLVLGCVKIAVGNASEWYSVRLHGADDTSTAVDLNVMRESGEDAAEARMVGVVGRHKAVTSNVDLAIDAYEQSASANHDDRGSYLIAIKASAFADFVHDYASGTISVGSETTVATSGSYTPSVNGDHLIIGRDERAPGTGLAKLHLEDGTTETRTGDSGPSHNQNWNTAQDQEPAFTMQRISVTGATTYNLRSTDSTTRDHQNRWLLILNLNEATSGNSYDETGLTVTVVSTVAGTDAVTLSEPATVNVTSSVSSADTATFNEPGPVPVIATVSGTDGKASAESLAIAVSSGVSGTDLLYVSEIGKIVAVTVTASSTDVASLIETTAIGVLATLSGSSAVVVGETGLLVTVVSTVTGTDTHDIGAIDYDETGKVVNVSSVVSGTDAALRRESSTVAATSNVTTTDVANLVESSTTAVISGVTGTDALSLPEPGAVNIVSSVTGTDVAAKVETGTIDITSTVTGNDSISSAIDETGLVVAVASTVTSADTATKSESAAIPVLANVTGTDTTGYVEADHQVDIVASVAGTDVYISGGTGYDETGGTIPVTSMVTATDTAFLTDTATISISAIVTGIDGATYADPLVVTVVATVTGVDVHNSGSVNYDETGVLVSVVVTVDSSHYGTLSEAVSLSITSSALGTDAASLSEALSIAIVATITSIDQFAVIWTGSELATTVIDGHLSTQTTDTALTVAAVAGATETSTTDQHLVSGTSGGDMTP